MNGYGQNSPLYTIFSQCTSLGRGVEYDVGKGLCNFTESYCRRFGLDFFFNEDLGVYDCELGRGQQAAEYLFGTTVTRSAKRAGQTVGRFFSLGASNTSARSTFSALGVGRDPDKGVKSTCYKALGSTRVSGGVQMKSISNGETFNAVQAKSALRAIKTLGLSGFQ